jgi:hypothetical protein
MARIVLHRQWSSGSPLSLSVLSTDVREGVARVRSVTVCYGRAGTAAADRLDDVGERRGPVRVRPVVHEGRGPRHRPAMLTLTLLQPAPGRETVGALSITTAVPIRPKPLAYYGEVRGRESDVLAIIVRKNPSFARPCFFPSHRSYLPGVGTAMRLGPRRVAVPAHVESPHPPFTCMLDPTPTLNALGAEIRSSQPRGEWVEGEKRGGGRGGGNLPQTQT